MITGLRAPGDIRRDRAILDLLHLQELGHAPGLVATRQLQLLWGCSQSQVSRRLAAIDRLPGWRVLWQRGPRAEAWISPAVAPSPRERWEAIRQRLA